MGAHSQVASVTILTLPACLSKVHKALISSSCQTTPKELPPQTSQTDGAGGCLDLTHGEPEYSRVSKRLLIRRGHADVFGSLSEAKDMRKGLLRRNVCKKVLEREIEDTLPTILTQAKV